MTSLWQLSRRQWLRTCLAGSIRAGACYAMGNMTTTSALEYAQAALVVSLRAADEAKSHAASA